MPTGVRKRGSGYVAVDLRSGRPLTRPTTKGRAEAFARIRDEHDRPKGMRRR